MHRKRGSAAVTGQYQHTIDAKGRLFIPAKLREELGDTFYVTMGMDSCLSIYSDASWARFTEKFESLPYTKTKAMRRSSPTPPSASPTRRDASCCRRSSEPTPTLKKTWS